MEASACNVGSSPSIKCWRTSGSKPAEDTKYWMKARTIQKTEKATVSQDDKTILEGTLPNGKSEPKQKSSKKKQCHERFSERKKNQTNQQNLFAEGLGES